MAPRVSSERPILCAVLDGAAFGSDAREWTLALFEAGVDWIQLRDRSLDANALLGFARMLVGARDHSEPIRGERRVIINRRIDVALTAGADGVHLGFDALRPTEAAKLLRTTALIGGSFHSIDEIRSIRSCRTSTLGYAHLAPIWDPLSKPASRPALGLEALREASAEGLLILAQGGIDPGRAAQAVRAGAGGVAVTGILGRSKDPIAAVRQIREALDEKSQPEG